MAGSDGEALCRCGAAKSLARSQTWFSVDYDVAPQEKRCELTCTSLVFGTNGMAHARALTSICNVFIATWRGGAFRLNETSMVGGELAGARWGYLPTRIFCKWGIFRVLGIDSVGLPRGRPQFEDRRSRASNSSRGAAGGRSWAAEKGGSPISSRQQRHAPFPLLTTSLPACRLL